MAGQTLGSRSAYVYTADDGTSYSLVLDDTLAAAGGLTAGAGNPSPPRRFQPRGVYVQASVGGTIARKFIVCNTTSTLYNTNASSTVVIDTVTFTSTGRVGEKLTFAS